MLRNLLLDALDGRAPQALELVGVQEPVGPYGLTQSFRSGKNEGLVRRFEGFRHVRLVLESIG